MRSITKALSLIDVSEIEAEVKERHILVSYMVGTLYPGIVNNEIYCLNQRIRILTTGEL